MMGYATSGGGSYIFLSNETTNTILIIDYSNFPKPLFL